MKKLLLVCLTALFSLATWGYDDTTGEVFTHTNDDGITLWYHTTSDSTCEVISPTEDKSHDIDGDDDKKINIPAEVQYNDKTYTVTRIDDRAFDYEVTYTNSKGEQANGRIYLANACPVTIPATVVSIGSLAFANQADMGNVTFSDGTEPLVFENTDDYGTVFKLDSSSSGGVSTLYIGRDLVLSGDSTTSSPFADLHGCLKTVQIGPTVTAIPPYLFYYRYTYTNKGNEGNSSYYAYLKTITFAEESSLKTIGAYAFSSEERMYSASTGELTTVTLPASLETIGEYAFSNMQDLTSVTLLGTTPPTVAANIFGDEKNMKYLSVHCTVPEDYLDTYQASDWGSVYYLVWDDATSEEIQVSAAQYDDNTYYATYYDSCHELTLPDGVTISVIGSVDSDGVLAESTVTYEDGNPSNQYPTVPSVDEHYVPAGNAVLLKSNTASYTITATPANTTPFIDGYTNILLGSDTETTTYVNGSTDGYYFYMLSYDYQGENLGFYWGADSGAPFTSAAHKAWLALDATKAANLSKLSFKKEDIDTTGIAAVSAATSDGAIYTLQGVRVADMSKKGIYIVDGKKVLVK